MVRKERLVEIKKDIEMHKKLIESRRRYRENIKKDPIRYGHFLEMHKKHEKNRRLRNIEKERKLARDRYNSLNEKEKFNRRNKIRNARIIRREKIINEWGNKCQKCGYSEHPEILEFDHKKALFRKTNGIKKLVSDHMLKEVREHPEIFELICPNCHRYKTINEIKEHWEKKRKIKLDNL